MIEINLAMLSSWIDGAIKDNPPLWMQAFCKRWYSPYYLFMLYAAQYLKYDEALLVELGVEQGRGLAALGMGVKGGSSDVIGIDHTKKVDIEGNTSGVKFLERGSLPPPPEVTEAGRQIALLHIDTEHSYAQAQAEFEAYKPYLMPGAVVIFDDLHAQEDAVLRYFTSLPYPKIIDDRMHPETGWGVLLYTGDE